MGGLHGDIKNALMALHGQLGGLSNAAEYNAIRKLARKDLKATIDHLILNGATDDK